MCYGVYSNQNQNSTFDAFRHDYSNVEINKNTEEKKEDESQESINCPRMRMKMGKIKPFDTAIVDTVTVDSKDNHHKLRTLAIVGGSAATIGGATLLATKGKVPRILTKKLGELTQKLSKHTENAKEFGASELYVSVLQKINKGLMMVRGVVFNVTPFKDVLFDKVVCDYLHLRKPCDAITNGFRSLSFATVKSNYRKTGSAVESMTSLFNRTNKRLAAGQIAGAKSINPETLTSLNEKITQIGSEFNANFSESAINKRNSRVSDICKNLNQRVFKKVFGNIKNFVKDVKSWTTFIPEALIEKDKSVFLNSLLEKKRVITNNPKDNFTRISQFLTNIEQSINPSDKKSRETLNTLKRLSQKYVNASGETEAITRTEVCNKINSILKQSKEIFSNSNYTPEESKHLSTLLNQIGEIINTDKKGLIEEILTTYKEILPPKEYAKLKASAQKAINKINSSTLQEGNEYVDKVRDLTDGSALTDVALSMIMPLATTSVAISAAETKEKKQTVALKYGIPILTGALTSTIATVKLVAGGKSLALGLASTFITNQICDRIDKKLKQKSSITSPQN